MDALEQEGFTPWRNSADEIIGWKMAATTSPTGSVLIVHGNAGCALDRSYIARPIHEAGAMDVLVLEYPGYGARSGTPGQKSFLAAGEKAFAALPTNMPIYVVSESIGAGVAAHLAKVYPDGVTGMVMFVPYDNLASVAQSKMPLLLPYLFLMDRYKPAEWMKGYRGPVTMVIAGADEIIPPKSGQRLFDSYAGAKTLQIISGARHNDVAEQLPEWWQNVFGLWAKHPARQSKAIR